MNNINICFELINVTHYTQHGLTIVSYIGINVASILSICFGIVWYAKQYGAMRLVNDITIILSTIIPKLIGKSYISDVYFILYIQRERCISILARLYARPTKYAEKDNHTATATD